VERPDSGVPAIPHNANKITFFCGTLRSLRLCGLFFYRKVRKDRKKDAKKKSVY
jgi:hypothetical protein